jgi:hypothetical protein
MSRGDGAMERALRPTEKELDAQRITIECVEPPNGGGDGYIVTVCPKPSTKKEKEAPYSVTEIKRVFASEEATLAYIKKVL